MELHGNSNYGNDGRCEMTLNREVFLKDPASVKLLNDGVASVKDSESTEDLEVLRHELETFVCKGL